MTIRPLLHTLPGLLLYLVANVSSAYELTAADYAAMGDELPAWDHNGRLPEGASQRYELERIDQQIEERLQRLRVSAFLLKQMESMSPDPERFRSVRADYATQQRSFALWRESVERRREAILGQLGGQNLAATGQR